jgi:hypothetical protein
MHPDLRSGALLDLSSGVVVVSRSVSSGAVLEMFKPMMFEMILPLNINAFAIYIYILKPKILL